MLQFVGLLLQWIQTLRSLDLILNIHSGSIDLRQIGILRGYQPIVDFDAAGNCHHYFTTMKAMNFQDDITSIQIDNLKDHFVLVFDLTSTRCYWKLSIPRTSWWTTEVGGLLYVSSRTRFWTLCIGRTNVFACSWQVWSCWKKHLKRKYFTLANTQLYPTTQVLVPWLFSLRLCSNFWQWHFCHWKYATQQYAGWALNYYCKIASNIVFCRLSWSWKEQFSQAAIWTDDARTTTVPSQRLRFLHNICSFPSLQIPTRTIYRSSRC